MSNELLFLSPSFKERIWGGQQLNKEFGYELPYEKTGEAWVISAHTNGPSVVENGKFAGKTLTALWEQHEELFNKDVNDVGAYPLLVKVIDANADLSVQVHPDDRYAREVENVPFGKTECWFVLDAKEDANIVLGHTAQNKNEWEDMLDKGKWDELLQRKTVQAGDFFYVPSGTIHAIGEGILILEIQQSSDITYRVYDYDRKDEEGNKRDLHLEQAKQVTTIPHQSTTVTRKKNQEEDLEIETLVEQPYFSVYHWRLDGHATRKRIADFLQVSVIKGSATIQVEDKVYSLEKGQHFIIPYSVDEYKLNGEAEMIVSHM